MFRVANFLEKVIQPDDILKDLWLNMLTVNKKSIGSSWT